MNESIARTRCLRRVAFATLLLLSFGALAEHYTVPLLVLAGTSGEPQGVVRILNGTDESGTVEIYAIDDAGTRSGPATFMLNASAAVQFTATDLASGNATLGLTGGIGSTVGDARLQIETDLSIVPLAFVRAADGTLSAMHDTVRDASVGGSDGYTYEVPIFNPASDVTQVSRLRLINPGDAAAAVTIGGRDDSGAVATGGDVTLTLAAGGAQTLTAQQLEAGDTAITGRLGAGTGKWRLTVMSDRPLQVVNIVAATAGYWNNLSTTAAPGAAPVDLDAFNERFVGNAVVYVTGSSRSTLNAQMGERFTETAEVDGVSTTYMGSYDYSAIGADAGRLTLTYDDADTCAANLYFSTHTAGWFASHCTGSDYPAAGTRQGGNWSVERDGAGEFPETTYGVDEALPGVPNSGYFSPPTLAGASSFSASGGRTEIALDNTGYFVLRDGTRYTCTSTDGCTVTDGTVTRGAVTGVPAGAGEVDRFPTFRAAIAPGSQAYTVGTAIEALVLPEASGGNGTLTYGLSPNVPGLSFDASTRRLAGTPETVGTYAMMYTVTDEDGDTDALVFSISVGPADVGDDGAAAGFELHEDNFFPQGLTFANGRFYVLDSIDGRVNAYSDSGQRDTGAEFDLHEDNEDPEGIAYGNERFYVPDSTDGRVYAYGGGGQRDAAAEFDLHEDNEDPSRIAYGNGRLRVYDWFDHRVYAYGDDGQRDTAAEFDLHPDNAIPAGIAFAHGLLYVVDEFDGKVYAYGDDGRRDSGAEFDLSADNGYPGGIAYADGRFFVVDWLGDRIYGYGEVGTSPRFESTDPDDRTYTAGTAIEAWTLPGASGGDGTLTYSLSPEVPGLTFNADTRQLGGTPTEAGMYAMTYTATDADGDTDSLSFTIAVQPPQDDGDAEYGVDDTLPGIPTSGVFVPSALSGGRVSATAAGTTITLNDDGYFELGDGSRYTCSSSDGCAVADGVVTRGTVARTSAGPDAVDMFPTFRAATAPGNRTYAAGRAIGALTLPQASGGNGTLAYALAPNVPGLSFDAAARRLTGTPATAGTYVMTYTVTDEDGYTDSLTFTITVEQSGDSGYDLFRTYRTGDSLPNVPTSGAFEPAVLSRGGISSTVDGTSIFLVQSGYIGLDDGTLYTCVWPEGCGIEDGTVTRGAVVVFSIVLSAEISNASGVAYGDGRIHVADAGNRRVHAYSSAGQRDPSADFDLDAGDYPGGIAYADGLFVVVDENPLKASSYTAAGQRDPSVDFDLDAENDRPSGIAYVDGRFQVVDLVDNSVYAYSPTGQREVSSDFDLIAENNGPTGIVHANGRFYVLDINEDKVFAYLETGQRDAAADFDLYGGNRGGDGITYGNGRFIVVDSLRDRVRVYFYAERETGLHFPEGASTSRTMPENLPSGIDVGEPVSATGGEMLSYTIGGIDAGSFSIVSDTGQIRTVENVVYDYETKNEYRVDVSAANGDGERDSIEVTIHLQDLVPSCGFSDELNPHISASDRRLTLRWSPVQPIDGQQAAVGYETEIRRGDAGTWDDRRTFLGRNFTHMVYADLDNEIDYQVRVRAVNEEGTCEWSTPVTGIPTADLAPENPTEFVVRHAPLPVGTPERSIRFLTLRRCRHTGGGVSADAECTYESTGPNTGRIFLEFDDPSRGSCEVTLAYSSLTAGSFIDECFDAGVNTSVPFDTSFTMPPPSPQGDDGLDPPPTETVPQRAPRNQDEFDALVHELGDFIPGLCFGYCLSGLRRSGPPSRGVATRITHGGRTHAYGDYTYESTGPSQGIISLTDRFTGEVWSFALDVEPSGNIRVTITPPDGGASVWPGMPHLDLTLGAQSVLLPIPPSWSAAIAIEADSAPADIDSLHDLVQGTCAFDSQPAVCALLGDDWDRAFIGPDGEVTPQIVHRLHGYRKVGPNRGMLTLSWSVSDPIYRRNLTQFQNELLGTTWVYDLTFTADGAARVVLTVTKDGHLPQVREGFVDFVGDGIDLDTFPDELLLPEAPPQAAGEDFSGVAVAAAFTSRSIGDDDLQTFLVSDNGATYSPGDWLEPKDGTNQRMMIVGTGQTAGAAAFGVAGYAAQGGSATQGLLLPAEAHGPMTLSVVCMQISGGIPTRGARYFSRPKPPETAVQRCQRDCVLAGGDAIQSCVWRCETTAVESASVPQASSDFGAKRAAQPEHGLALGYEDLSD